VVYCLSALRRLDDVEDTAVHETMGGKVQPTWDSVIKTTGGRAEDPIPLLRLAGALPDYLSETTDEEDAARILRALPFHLRQVALWMLRGIQAEYLRGGEPRTLLDEGCC
jgi:hypothetical protein